MRSYLSRFRRRGRVDFYAATYIDEVWLRSTIHEVEALGLNARLIVSGDRAEWPVDFEAQYASSQTPLVHGPSQDVLRDLGCEIVVSASSGVPRQYFGKTLRRLIHMPHSLASLHVIYPSDAFDGFDTLFAAGPHHVREFQALGRGNGLGRRKTHEVGYGKLDVLRAERPAADAMGSAAHILIAPSWGEANLIKAMGHALIGMLLDSGYRVTLRPHPSFFLKEEPEMKAIMQDYIGKEGFTLERSTGGSQALWTAEVMVCDYSGMAMEFAALRGNPIVFADLPGKTLNPDWKLLDIAPAEVALRNKIGRVVDASVQSVFEAVKLFCEDADTAVDVNAATPLYLFDFPHVGGRAAELVLSIAEGRA